MAAKKIHHYHFGRAQSIELRPITDPAEIAALDERLRLAEIAAKIARRREALDLLKKPTPAEVLKLARRLSPDERAVLIAKLATQLTPDKRKELLAELTTVSSNGTARKSAAGMWNAK